MSVLQEYKCPCCDGAIAFDTSVQKMKCPYCDTEFELEAISSYNDDLNGTPAEDMSWGTSENNHWQDGEEEALCGYVCSSCGGEIVSDENTAATACPFCGSPVVMTGRVSGSLKPDLVIPFQLDKKAAKEGLKKHLSGKKLLPKVFSDENHIDEIRGVYVPVWLFDTEADGQVRFKCTRSRVWQDRNYIYTETKYYSVQRSGTMAFADIPVDGSTKMADDLMESIEPFDLKQAVDFQTAYLSGYLADTYDVSAEDCMPRANQRVKETIERALADTVRREYDSAVPESSAVQYQGGQVRFALYPVWVLQTSWQGQNYLFAMNGQTGKFVGNLPMDKKAWWKWWGIYGAVSSAVVLALAWLFTSL